MDLEPAETSRPDGTPAPVSGRPALSPGDLAAFEKAIRETGPRMLAVALRVLGNEADAAEAVQDAYVSAFRNLGTFQGGSQLSTWLHRIVVNAALMKRRSRGRRHERSVEDLLPRFDDTGHRTGVEPAWDETADELAERAEVRVSVRRHIEELPDDFREVIMLRDIEQLDTQEAAEVLGISAAAVKTRLHRARMALRTLLERDLSPPEPDIQIEGLPRSTDPAGGTAR